MHKKDIQLCTSKLSILGFKLLASLVKRSDSLHVQATLDDIADKLHIDLTDIKVLDALTPAQIDGLKQYELDHVDQLLDDLTKEPESWAGKLSGRTCSEPIHVHICDHEKDKMIKDDPKPAPPPPKEQPPEVPDDASPLPVSIDRNRNGIPDEEEVKYIASSARMTTCIYIFGMALTAVALVYIFLITWMPIPTDNVRFADTALGFIIGTLLGSVINFFFGTSMQKADYKSMTTKSRRGGVSVMDQHSEEGPM